MGRPRARIHSALCGACAWYARKRGPCRATAGPHRFAEEITEYDDKLNFYIPVTFDCDAVFGTDVCSPDNDDYLIIYVDYDMFTGEVGNQLDIALIRADGRIDELSYPLDEAERSALLPKMERIADMRPAKASRSMRRRSWASLSGR